MAFQTKVVFIGLPDYKVFDLVLFTDPHKVCLKIIRMGLSIDISTIKGRSLDLQSSAESWVNFRSFGIY